MNWAIFAFVLLVFVGTVSVSLVVGVVILNWVLDNTDRPSLWIGTAAAVFILGFATFLGVVTP